MPDAATLLSFAATAILIELTPGPNMAWLAMVAVTEGRRTGFAAVAGVALGLAAVGIGAALGLAALVAGSPGLYQALRWGGAAYLLWLAWDGWRDAAADDPAGADLPPGAAFRRGLVTNLLNPKAAVFYVAVLPTFLGAATGATAALVLSGVYVAVATAIHAMIVAAAGTANALLSDPQRERRIRRVLAATLVPVALWLLWKT